MTPDEIAALHARIDALEKAVSERCARIERLVWLVVGVGIGSGALTLSQILGA